MSAQADAMREPAAASMSVFERYLTVWVFLCIVTGIALGQVLPGVFQILGTLELAKVNIPVGLLIWVMIIPMLVRIDFGALHRVRDHWKGIGVTLFVNWAVKPFSMALLAWIFVRPGFPHWPPPPHPPHHPCRPLPPPPPPTPPPARPPPPPPNPPPHKPHPPPPPPNT